MATLDEMRALFQRDPTQQIQYQIKDGKVHFGHVDMTNLLGVDMKLGRKGVRLCSWNGFHIFVAGLVSGWSTIEKGLEFKESLRKGKIPDMLKNCDRKTLDEVRNYKPPKNYDKVHDAIKKISRDEMNKIIAIKEKLSNPDMLMKPAADQIMIMFTLVIKDKKLSPPEGEVIIKDNKIVSSSGDSAAEIKGFLYKRPLFSVDAKNELELKLVRFFILRDEITPSHAKLILPVVEDFLDTISKQPGIRIPKEMIELEIKYFNWYIKLLETSVKEKITIKGLYLK